MDFPEICKLHGWDPEALCGPVVCAMCKNREDNCCFDHPKGCPKHRQPKVNGAPFSFADHKEDLAKRGLAVLKPELVKEGERGQKPPGPSKLINGVTTYPARHFH